MTKSAILILALVCAVVMVAGYMALDYFPSKTEATEQIVSVLVMLAGGIGMIGSLIWLGARWLS